LFVQLQLQGIFDHRFFATEKKFGAWPGGQEKVVLFN
jgi:hypothetical protein